MKLWRTHRNGREHKAEVAHLREQLAEQGQEIREIAPQDRVAADPDTGGLSLSGLCNLPDGLVGQCTASGNDADGALLMNISRHYPDLARPGCDNPRTVRADEMHIATFECGFDLHHV